MPQETLWVERFQFDVEILVRTQTNGRISFPIHIPEKEKEIRDP